MIGQTISHYKITAKLGAGGMGEVYLAEDTKLKRKVALKFLPQSFTKDVDTRSRFQREAEALAALNHPNIVTVFDVSEHEHNPYIVMEYIEGQSLRELVATGDLPIDRILDIVSQVADGLSAAHKREIIHRDIKSENIIVSSEGRVKIMDFGLATWRGVSKVTKEGSTVGTMAYMSPEQAEGRKVDHRADLFSLGVVLYELITGRLPFSGDHEAAIIYSIVNETPEPLARYKSNLPDGLQEIIGKALEKDPELRHQTASGFLSDIRRLRRLSESSVSVTTTGATSPPPRRRKALISSSITVAVIALLLAVFKPWRIEVKPTQEAAAGRKMLAVLPFENLGAEDQEYFADGVTEEITARLAGISEIGVVSRQSSMQYKASRKSLREIGRDLGVDYILEGTIRWDRSGPVDRVRITPQLVFVGDDTHLWADVIDQELTEIFAVQTAIATKVVDALQVTLKEGEANSLTHIPTENLEAHQVYLRGLEFALVPDASEEHARQRVQIFERAIQLDSSFALAHAELSIAHSWMCHARYDRTATRLAKAEAHARKALELQPDLPEGHLALGYYYYQGVRDYDRALEEFRLAERGRPNDSKSIEATAYVLRRLGDFGGALRKLTDAFKLDPMNAWIASEIGTTCMYLHKFGEAEKYLDMSISLQPDQILSHAEKAQMQRYWLGDLEESRKTLLEVPSSTDPDVGLEWYWQAMWERDYQAALMLVDSIPAAFPATTPLSEPPSLLKARIYFYEGKDTHSRHFFDSARVALETRVKESPEEPWAHSMLGFVYAGLDRKEESIREAETAVELLPISKDAIMGPPLVENLAIIQAMVGDYEASLDNIENLLSIPCGVSLPNLELNPCWDPLRDHPRFQALLEKGDKVF
jgi:non-specific serine/threonine protein kinase